MLKLIESILILSEMTNALILFVNDLVHYKLDYSFANKLDSTSVIVLLFCFPVAAADVLKFDWKHFDLVRNG